MVLKSARPHLKSLEKLAHELNAASDAFADELKAVSAELGALNLGVDVTLVTPLVRGDLEDDIGENGTVLGQFRLQSHLAYGRYAGGWGLVVREYRQHSDYDVEDVLVDTTPLMSASRDIRLAAAGQIDDLLQLIATTAEEKLKALAKVSDRKG